MFGLQILNTIKRLLPPKLRKPKMMAWLFRSFSPLRKTKVSFDNLRDYWNYNLKFNTQTLSLEERLNQHYNLISGSIYIITQNSSNDSVYTFWINENQPSPFIYFLSEGQTATYTTWVNENSSATADFIVYVPNSLVFDEEELKAIIDLYRLAGKQYSILQY